MSPLYRVPAIPASPDAAVAVAKEFSPRLQRYGDDCVVLDVSGLGRLLGDPQTIGAIAHRSWRMRSMPRDARSRMLTGRGSRGLRDCRARHRESRASRCADADGAMLLSLAHPGLTVADRRRRVGAGAGATRRTCACSLPELHGTTLLPRRAASRAGRGSLRHQHEQAFDRSSALGAHDARRAGGAAGRRALGAAGQARHRAAAAGAGVDRRPLVPDPDVPRFLERIELEWPIDGAGAAVVRAGAAARAAVAVARARRSRRRGHPSGSAARRSHASSARAAAAGRHARRARCCARCCMLDLESHPPPAAIDIVTIEIDPAPGRVHAVFAARARAAVGRNAGDAHGRLGALVGESRCGSGRAARHASDRMRSRCAGSRRMNVRGQPSPARQRSAAARQRSGSAVRAAALPSARRHPGDRRARPPRACRHRSPRDARRPRRAVRRPLANVGRLVDDAGKVATSGTCAGDGTSPVVDRDEWDVAFSDGRSAGCFRTANGARFLDGVYRLDGIDERS